MGALPLHSRHANSLARVTALLPWPSSKQAAFFIVFFAVYLRVVASEAVEEAEVGNGIRRKVVSQGLEVRAWPREIRKVGTRGIQKSRILL